uniref:Photosystem II reaction center Psb28 protein n=1 Tax=Cyanoptyche gloeocystis TaxID=77922 RepID=A0A3G1IW74_9EUKA|nr:photosystem II protein W [Cyanoptyche gloeocystis]|mmetsp:Transcript_12936/g.22372  ORF Transcript_12936/g.22372 Transcript_12936/m.22372 type:complete len:114 (+) Transcript_12936:36-377(+)
MAKIQFIKGIDEEIVPNVRLTHSRDGNYSTATFYFDKPSVFQVLNTSNSEITGMFLIDEEGELMTRDVNATFINGKPQALEALFTITNSTTWDRFIRFIERYAQKNNLSFTKA